MRHLLVPVTAVALLFGMVAVANATPNSSAAAQMTVSVEVVRPCTVGTTTGVSVECGGQTPSTVRVTTSPAPAGATTARSDAEPQSSVMTIDF
jgi:hypothetical protein